jgi:hypothetical protein
VRTAAEVGMMTIHLLLDLSKAFDFVRHELKLPKIAGAETSSNVLDWFESYLDGRFKKIMNRRKIIIIFSIFFRRKLNILNGKYVI